MKDHNKYLTTIIDNERELYRGIVNGNNMMINHIKDECEAEGQKYKSRILKMKRRYDDD